MIEKRRSGKSFDYAVLAVLLALFVAIIFALVRCHLPPEIVTLVGGWGGTVLAMIGVVVNNVWGSSKGSERKDEMLLRSPPPAAPAP
jgi:hypothetical protein